MSIIHKFQCFLNKRMPICINFILFYTGTSLLTITLYMIPRIHCMTASAHRPSLITLILLTSFAAAGTMILTPALPLMAESLSMSSEQVQYLVSIYLAGYALGMIPYGPLANRFGRKPTLYSGLLIACFGALLTIIAGYNVQFKLLLIGRFISAVGASVGLKIAYTIVGDLYSGSHATKKIATLMLGFPVASAFAMTAGGFLTQYFGWFGPLYALFCYSLFLLILSRKLPETSSEMDMHALGIKKMVRIYTKEVFYLPMVLCSLQVGMTCSILYVFAAKAPFLVIDVLGIRPDVYGILSFLPALGQAMGLSTSIYCAHRMHQLQAMILGVSILLTALSVIAFNFWFFGFSLLALYLPVPFVFMGNSLTTSNATSYALSVAHERSYASALVNSFGLCIASMGVFVSNFINFQNPWAFPKFFGTVALLALVWWSVLYIREFCCTRTQC